MRSKMLIAFAWQVFAAAFAHGQAREGMAYRDYARIFPRADYIRATPAAGNTPAWKAWRAAHDEDPAELAGYLFLIPVSGGGTERSLLIGVTQKLVIAGMKLEGKIELHEEFVSQFAGKRLNAKFEIAKTAADLLYVPAKVRAQEGQAGLSEGVVEAITKLAVLVGDPPQLGLK